MDDKQSLSETITFRRFAEVCPLDIDQDSIKKQDPPEPDIVCRLGESAEPVAFELVEIINEGWARLTSSQFQDADSLRAAYHSASGEFRRALDLRLSNALVYVAFVSTLSSRDRQAALTTILDVLSTVDADFRGDWHAQSGTPLFGKVRSVTIRRGDFQGPVFDVEAAGSISDPTVELIQAKWQKSYRTTYPIELLAYYELQPMFPQHLWLPRLKSFIEANWASAPFRRVWVFDVGGKSIPYSAARPA